MKSWTLIPHVGIEFTGTRILFGENWETIRKVLKTRDSMREGFNKFYENVLGTGCALRLELDFEDGLSHILFMRGSILYDGIELCNTRFRDLAAALIFKGMSVIRESSYYDGCLCPELCIVFGSYENFSGYTDRVDCIDISGNLDLQSDHV